MKPISPNPPGGVPLGNVSKPKNNPFFRREKTLADYPGERDKDGLYSSERYRAAPGGDHNTGGTVRSLPRSYWRKFALGRSKSRGGHFAWGVSATTLKH